MGDDDWTHPEIVRALHSLTTAVDELRKAVVPRETFELEQGFTRVEIGRLDTVMSTLDKRVDLIVEEHHRRFRNTVLLVLSGLVFPITSGLVVAILVIAARST